METMQNQTHGYHRDIFRPPTLLKMLFRRIKALFSAKNYQIFNLFEIQKFSDFLHNLNVGGKKTLKNNIIRYAFYSKFAIFTDFEKNFKFFFQKKTHLFCQKN